MAYIGNVIADSMWYFFLSVPFIPLIIAFVCYVKISKNPKPLVLGLILAAVHFATIVSLGFWLTSSADGAIGFGGLLRAIEFPILYLAAYAMTLFGKISRPEWMNSASFMVISVALLGSLQYFLVGVILGKILKMKKTDGVN